MKKKLNNIYGFTLIEIIVSITILSMILISVFSIYISSTDINLKTDITRTLQQNIKSSIEYIAEDVRKNWYDCVKSTYLDPCNLPSENITQSWSTLIIWSNSYYLAKKSVSGYLSVGKDQCDDISEKCTLVLNGNPIMNSWVDVKNIEFLVSNTKIKKVTILMTLQPAIWKWIKPDLIKNNRFHFQTTISERTNLN